MFKVAILLAAALVASVSSSSGEFSVLTSPASLEFKGDETLDSSLVGDVVLSALGHSIESQENWNGLFIRNPFQLPKTAVVFLVDGVDTVKSDAIKGHSYPLSGNAHSLDAVAGRLTHSLTIDLENNEEAVLVISETFGEIKPVAQKLSASGLKPNVNAEDKDFLNKLATLDALTQQLKSGKASTTPSLILVRLSMAALRNAHQDTPTANAEASDLLAQQLGQFVDAAQKYFGDNVLVATVASAEQLVRNRRDVPTQPKQEEIDDINLAKEYNESYPVVFNIILWFGVVMFFSLLAICLAIGNMDPGRDSIIYRMTSTRIKKEN